MIEYFYDKQIDSNDYKSLYLNNLNDSDDWNSREEFNAADYFIM